MVRVYLAVLQEVGARRATLDAMEPVSRTIIEAAFCFNAGLFFEAHEHLEHRWVALPRGPIKRFVQGIIQISVGLYHARRGSYHGAVNQLAKGLEKLGGLGGLVMGLDCDRFVREVTVFRQQLTARGSDDTGPLPLEEMPNMRLTDR
jgi:predicted metal-dependent hydrolase